MATMKSTLYGKSIEEGQPLLKDCFRRCHSLSLIRHGQDWIRGVRRGDEVVIYIMAMQRLYVGLLYASKNK